MRARRAATVCAAGEPAGESFDVRRLFLAHHARIRATCLTFAEPGVALFAFSTGGGAWQGSLCLAARPGELRAGVIGRHSAADLFLDARAPSASTHPELRTVRDRHRGRRLTRSGMAPRRLAFWRGGNGAGGWSDDAGMRRRRRPLAALDLADAFRASPFDE